MPDDRIAILGDRIEDLRKDADSKETRIKELSVKLDELQKRFEKIVATSLAVGAGFAVAAAIFGIVSWENFGTWVNSALMESTKKYTFKQIDNALLKAEGLIKQLEAQLNAPVRYFGKLSACQSKQISLREGEKREDFKVFLIPEVVDSATNTSSGGFRDNVVQMFETDVKDDPVGSGWVVSVNLRVLTRLTDTLAKDQTKNCKDPNHFKDNRSTFLIFATVSESEEK